MLLAINPPDPLPRLRGIEAAPIATEAAAAGVELFLFLQELEDGYDALWEYNSDLFDAETIDRIHAHYRRLLDAAVEEPDRPVDELPMLAAEERELLLRTWNDTSSEFLPTTLHELVEAQASRSPDAPAVVFEERRLSYADLDARANQLAQHLRACGVKRDALVAVSLERSPELVIVLLAILKAGGAYLPLDPELPQERLAFMLDDSGAKVVITDSTVLDRLPPFPGRLVCIDRDAAEIAREGTERPNAGAEPDDLAYCIYTSGSTGRPKGVLNTHRGIVNRLLAMQDSYRLDGVGQAASEDADQLRRLGARGLLALAVRRLPGGRRSERAWESALPRRPDRTGGRDDTPLRPLDAGPLPRRGRPRPVPKPPLRALRR